MRVKLTTLALLLLVACQSGPTPTASGEPNGEDPQGTWQLVEGTVDGQQVPILDEHRITLTIEGARISGTSACNSYGGKLTMEFGRLRIDGLEQTMKGCEEPAMGAEALYLTGLRTVDSISLDGDELLVTGQAVNLRFSELAPPPTAEMVDTVWVLETLITGDMAASAVGEQATLALRSDGTIHGGTGCRSFEGTWRARGDEIGMPSLDMDDRICQPELQVADGHVLTVIGDGFRASVEGDQLTLTDGVNGLQYRAAE